MSATYIVVSGAPGSGKTTLARALAQELGLALISKDTVKESLYESSVGHHSSTELSDAAMSVLWSVASECPKAILEANFNPKLSRPRLQALPGRKLEIHCACPLDICAARYAQRAASPEHHAVHPRTISRESLEKYAAPIGACEVIEVDTAGEVEIGELLARIRTRWPDV